MVLIESFGQNIRGFLMPEFKFYKGDLFLIKSPINGCVNFFENNLFSNIKVYVEPKLIKPICDNLSDTEIDLINDNLTMLKAFFSSEIQKTCLSSIGFKNFDWMTILEHQIINIYLDIKNNKNTFIVYLAGLTMNSKRKLFEFIDFVREKSNYNLSFIVIETSSNIETYNCFEIVVLHHSK